MRKRYTKGKKVVPNLQRGSTGRVGYFLGDAVRGALSKAQEKSEREQGREDEQDSRNTTTPTPTPTPTPTTTTQEEGRDNPKTESPFSGTKAGETSEAQREREFRADESGKRMEDMASGKITLDDIGAKGTAAKIIEQDDEILDSDKEAYKVDETAEALDSDTYKVSKKSEDLKEEVDTITKEELENKLKEK